MKHRQIRKPIQLLSLILLLASLPGCRINVVQDDYSLERIDGEKRVDSIHGQCYNDSAGR